jgi:hypothetical protein
MRSRSGDVAFVQINKYACHLSDVGCLRATSLNDRPGHDEGPSPRGGCTLSLCDNAGGEISCYGFEREMFSYLDTILFHEQTDRYKAVSAAKQQFDMTRDHLGVDGDWGSLVHDQDSPDAGRTISNALITSSGYKGFRPTLNG